MINPLLAYLKEPADTTEVNKAIIDLARQANHDISNAVVGPAGPAGPLGPPGLTVPDIPSLTECTVPVGDDLLVMYDTSAGAAAKLTFDNFPLPMNCLEGGQATNAADANNDITIQKMRRRDSTNMVNIILTSALTKQLDFKFVAGTNAGGADLGMTVAYVTAVDATNLCTVECSGNHGLTTGSTVIIPNLAIGDAAISAHLAAANVITTTADPKIFTLVLDGHDLARTAATEGVVIACSVGAIATYPGATYYMYLGLNGTTVDAFFSYSATGATPPTGYTYFRMILALRTSSTGAILPGTWSDGNRIFHFTTPNLGRTYATFGTTNRIVTVPSGAPANSKALMNFTPASDAATRYLQFNAVSDADVAPSTDSNSDVVISPSQYAQYCKTIWTDAAGYIAARASGVNCGFGARCIEFWLPLGSFDYP